MIGQDFWTQNKPIALHRVRVLEETVRQTLLGCCGFEQRRGGQREAHKLAGSLGSLGFSRASALAAQIEQILQGPAGADEGLKLSLLVADLRRCLEEAPQLDPEEKIAETDEADEARFVVVYLGPEDGRWDRLQRLGGVHLVRQEEPGWPLQKRPDLLLLSSLDPGLLEIARLCSATNLAVAAFAEEAIDLGTRVTALRHGVLRILDPDSESQAMLGEVEQLLPGAVGRPLVLALDDDPIQLRVLDRLLRGQGFQLETVRSVEEFWVSLKERRPDLLLLDLEMPNYSGLDLCLTLRAQPITEDIAVMFVSANDNPRVWEDLYAAGADDCLTKPLSSRELVLRIRNRLLRTQAIRNHSILEPGSGISRWRYTRANLLRMMGLTDRLGGVLSMGMLHWRGAGAVIDSNLRSLTRCLASEDTLGRFRRDSTILGLLQTEAEAALEKVQQWLRPLQSEDCQVWAGLVEYPRDGLTLDLLCERARACAELAQSHGQLVWGYGLEGGRAAAEAVDVAIVEDDELLAPVVMQALTQKGYRCRWLKRGGQALELLGGLQPPLRPRVVILDWDLPDVSGLEVLEGLRQDGSLRRTRVIVFTVRSKEEEVLRALAMGAYDHLTKPSSLQVLVERVRLAMRA